MFRFLALALNNQALAWISLLFGTAVPVTAERFFVTFLAGPGKTPGPVSRWVVGGSGAFLLLLVYGALFYPLHHSYLFTVPLGSFVFGALLHCMYLMF